MKYLLLIYGGEEARAARTDDQRRTETEAYVKYTRELRAAGVLIAGDPLQPTFTATTVRVRGGQTTTTDGPFAETKEQLGGYYLIDVPSLDEALAWAARIPGAAVGSIEVRPLQEFDA
ncbi:MAG: YciI family protein [Myxococcota bacterium]